MSSSKRPLEGVRVLEMGRLIAAPFCAQILGDLGADVIKIERPGAGDDVRGYGPPFLGGEESDRRASAFFLSYNRNKRSIAIDIGKPEGAELVRSLAKTSDVFIENYRIGALRKYGLDAVSMRELCEPLIYLSVSGFGQTGPYASRASTDVILQGMSGLMSVTGEADGPPLKNGVSIVDLTTGMFGAIGVIAALFRRNQDGGKHGDWVGASLLESAMTLMSSHTINYQLTGVAPMRNGNSAFGSSPSNTFSCRDGNLQLQAGKDADFVRLCAVLGLQELASDPRFHVRSERVKNDAELMSILVPVIQKWDRDSLYNALLEASVICGPVYDVDQVLDDPHVQARDLQRPGLVPGHDEMKLMAHPIEFGSLPNRDFRLPPPKVGEHTAEVLRERLSLDDNRIAELAQAGAIGV